MAVPPKVPPLLLTLLLLLFPFPRVVPAVALPACVSLPLSLPSTCPGSLVLQRTSLYDVLSVPPTASVEDIKAAFKALAKQLHPDVNPDPSAGERFRAANEAYHTLVDPDKRRVYDIGVAANMMPEMAGLRRPGSRSVSQEQISQYFRLRQQALHAPAAYSPRTLLFLLAVPTAFLVGVLLCLSPACFCVCM